jgi:hypothetical protein
VAYSRGHDDGTSAWVYFLGRTVALHPWAGYHSTDSTTPEDFAFGTEGEMDRFYHWASVWDGSTAKIYVNGELQSTTAMIGSQLKALTNGSYIGRWNNGGMANANIQMVKLYPEAKSAAWIKAEYQMICSRAFYGVEKGFSATYG